MTPGEVPAHRRTTCQPDNANTRGALMELLEANERVLFSYLLSVEVPGVPKKPGSASAQGYGAQK
jgi:hypothetical protein